MALPYQANTSVFADPSHQSITNLYPLFRPNQGKELNHFVSAFVKTLEEHVADEQRKHPAPALAPLPGSEDVVLSEAAVRRISPTVHRFRRQNPKLSRPVDPVYVPARTCRHHDSDNQKADDNSSDDDDQANNTVGGGCRCPISHRDRKMKAFLHTWVDNPCYQFLEHNEAAYVGLQTLKVLLMYGEMDAVVRICSHPAVDYLKGWSRAECFDTTHILGWDLVCKTALRAYLCLNVMHCYPRLWDPASGRTPERDYRRTSSYQRMLRESTLHEGKVDFVYFPHRQFFGITDGQFNWSPRPHDTRRWGKGRHADGMQDNYPYGIMPIEDILELEAVVGYQPKVSDIAQVRLALGSKGLPLELVLTIMELADYTPKRRLEVPHDPLHVDNSVELRRYLTYCWQLIIRSEVMARALGSTIDWKKLVTTTIMELWGIWHDYSHHTPTSDMAEVEWGWEGPEVNGQSGYKAVFI